MDSPLHEQGTGWSGMTAIWSYAGCPSITILAAAINNMPLGLQCIGNFGKDEELLFWAKQLSKHFVS